MPYEYVTKIIDPEGNELSPIFEMHGRTVAVSVIYEGQKELLGEATFNPEQTFSRLDRIGNARYQSCELYVEMMRNYTFDYHNTPIPKFRHVGTALLEYLFRLSALNEKTQGRIRVDASYGSEYFYTNFGFKVLPTNDFKSFLNDSNCKVNADFYLLIQDFWDAFVEEKDDTTKINRLGRVLFFLVNKLDGSTLSVARQREHLEVLQTRDLNRILNLFWYSTQNRLTQNFANVKNCKRQLQQDNGCMVMFLPAKVIMELKERYQISNNKLQTVEDDFSRLNEAMHSVDYSAYSSPHIDEFINLLIVKYSTYISMSAIRRGIFDGESAANSTVNASHNTPNSAI
ncbi:MAG: hypothetical protein A3F18_00615 [Legionellales bacterium RIFCSPHIGHO2_12_FULL_37_14]|nr:MAG: hypothetical protein A3F18_00615 [Legionellales bacterium RIFCSPHIGHO2_12_FULL_37_14]